ncbi:hypothetical protein ZWY2020_036059, partial [Hordeum vulgare]
CVSGLWLLDESRTCVEIQLGPFLVEPSRWLNHHDGTSCFNSRDILLIIYIYIYIYIYLSLIIKHGSLLLYKKRPTEFGMNQVLRPFHNEKFNFTKVKPEEVIFRFQETENDSARYFDGAPPTISASPSSILINVSPIGYCHVLLIPQVQECLRQRVDQESFLLAMYVAKEARNPFIRVVYKSLGAFATINHLHFQAYYLKVQYPVEKAPTEELTVCDRRSGFVFEGGAGLEDLSQVVSNACIFLQENNRPFNVLISESAKRVFLLLQCYAEKQTSGKASQEFLNMTINPAVWELNGHLVLKRRKD